MDNPTTEKPARAKRAPRTTPRRDFAKEVRAIEAYCLAAIDILEAHQVSDFGSGQIALAKSMLVKLGVVNGK